MPLLAVLEPELEHDQTGSRELDMSEASDRT